MNCNNNGNTYEGCSYRPLTPFKYFCMTAFPYIEADFDALTNYELLCRIVDYLNNTRSTVNDIGTKTEELCTAFNNLKDYVDNYFDNLDIQEEVDNYIDSLMESGEIVDVIRQALSGTLVDVSLWRPYGQILPDLSDLWDNGLYAQGSAIGVINSRPVMCVGFTDDTETGSDNVITFTYLDTGETFGRYNIASGHCNDITFNPENNHFYIACGGGNSTSRLVLEITTTGTIADTHTLPDAAVYQIAYNQGYFYVTQTSRIFRKYKTDFSAYETIELDFAWADNYTTQSLYADDLYLYFPVGNTYYKESTIPKNYIYVYTHDGSFYKRVDVRSGSEIEGINIYNDTCYATVATQHRAFIIIIDLHISNAAGYLDVSMHMPANPVSIQQTIYIDETYTSFAIDPENTNTPLAWLAGATYFTRPNTTELNINLKSDCHDKNGVPLAIFGMADYGIRVTGNNHKIPRINVRAASVQIYNLTLTESGTGNLCQIVAQSVFINNLTIGESTSDKCNRGIFIKGATEINGLVINSTPNTASSNPLIYIEGNGYIRNTTINHETGELGLFGFFQTDETTMLNKQFWGSINRYRNTAQLASPFPAFESFNLKAIRRPLCWYVSSTQASNVTWSGFPTGYDTSTLRGISAFIFDSQRCLIALTDSTGTITWTTSEP